PPPSAWPLFGSGSTEAALLPTPYSLLYCARTQDGALGKMGVLQAIEAELEKSRAALLTTAEQVPEAQFHVRPSEEAWSVSEILHHLVLVENRIVDRVGPAISGARAQGAGPEPADPTPHLRSLDHLQIERVTRPIQSRTIPESGHERAELLAGLGESRTRLLSVMKT